MAILVNMGKRGFILKDGFLAAGQEIVVDTETGEKLAATYKTELKLIVPEQEQKAEVKEVIAEEVEPKVETPKAKRKYTRKAK